MPAIQKKTIYWLAATTAEDFQQKIGLLQQQHFQVRHFRSLEMLIAEYTKARASIIVIADSGAAADVEFAINQLSTLPEFKGIKLILSVSSTKYPLMKIAFNMDFKDIIPDDLSAENWLQRLMFSIAAGPVQYKMPSPLLTLNENITVGIPARIVWLSPKAICIEARLKSIVSDHLALTGPIAAHFGVKTVPLHVTALKKTDLLYRFSYGMICRYQIPAGAEEKLSRLRASLAASSATLGCKVFLVVKTPELRKDLIDQLIPQKFEVLTAVNQRSITSDPQFFNPDLVIVQSVMCKLPHLPSIHEMAGKISPDTPILIIGGGANEEIAALQNRIKNRVYCLSSVPSNLAATIFEKVLTRHKFSPPDAPSDAIILGAGNAFSVGEIVVASKLTKFHPHAAEVMLPVQLGNFGICRIDCSYLRHATKGPVFAKVVSCTEDTAGNQNHRFRSHANLALAMPRDTSTQLADLMLDTLKTYLKKLSENTPLPVRKAPAEKLTFDDILRTVEAVPITLAAPTTGSAVPTIKATVRTPTAAVKPLRKATHTAADDERTISLLDGLRDIPAFLRRQLKHPTIKAFLTIVLFGILTFLLLKYALSGLEYLAQFYHKSGTDYSNQLHQFHGGRGDN